MKCIHDVPWGEVCKSCPENRAIPRRLDVAMPHIMRDVEWMQASWASEQSKKDCIKRILRELELLTATEVLHKHPVFEQ